MNKVISAKVIILLFLIYSIPAFAEKALEEQNELSEVCENYITVNQNKTITDAYPVFAGSGAAGSIYGFDCLNLAKGQQDKYVCIYSFENIDLNEAYDKLQEILSNRHKKKNKNIILRKSMPLTNAEDRLNLIQSVKEENKGYTCYYYKNNNELCVERKPLKSKEDGFIIKENNKNTDIYFYGSILPNE